MPSPRVADGKLDVGVDALQPNLDAACPGVET